MRASVFSTTLLAIALAGGARAGGLALRWDHCLGEGNGVFVRSFACDTNLGADRVVGSFVTDLDVRPVVGLEITVYVSTCPFVVGDPCPAAIPPWWTFFATGTCRQSSLTADFYNDPANAVCEPWTPGVLAGGIDYTVGFFTASMARLRAVSAVALSDTAEVLAGHEYTAFTLTIDHRRTVGTGACGGCTQALGLYINTIRVVTLNDVNDYVVATPLGSQAQDLVYWQSAPIPTRASTWAGVKALYR